jgi:hypothetical protein
MQLLLDQAPDGFKKVIDEFLQESQAELFNSEEECLDWSRQNYEALKDGSLGGNLLSKYSMIGRFYSTADTLDFLRTGILASLGRDVEHLKVSTLDTVIEYLKVILLSVPFAESLSQKSFPRLT